MSKPRLYTLLCIGGAAMLSVIITVIAIATTKSASAKLSGSSGACNANANSLEYDVDHMCEGNSKGILTVSYASELQCDEVIQKSEATSEPTIKWSAAAKVWYLL